MLKILGLIVLLLWMGFITFEIEETKKLAYEACGYVILANQQPRPDSHAFGCPDIPPGSYNPF
jgi:hypothetical protein